MIELRIRNHMRNIVSNEKELCFAWAAYYANKSHIFINGIEYFVDIVFNSNVVFNNNTCTGHGNWVIFKADDHLLFYDKNYLNIRRLENPLTANIYCFSDDKFLSAIS